MSEPGKLPPARAAQGADKAARREDRLAAALRANLGRRKSQSRGRDDAKPPPEYK